MLLARFWVLLGFSKAFVGYSKNVRAGARKCEQMRENARESERVRETTPLQYESHLDVEVCPDLFGCPAFDHVCNSLTRKIQQGLAVQIVGCQDNVKQCSLW